MGVIWGSKIKTYGRKLRSLGHFLALNLGKLGKIYMAHLGTWGSKTHVFGVVLRESARVSCKSSRVLIGIERFWSILRNGMCRNAR